MGIVKRNVQVSMVRADLEHIPDYALPPGYAARWHAPGDEHTWVAIHQAAERFVPTSLRVFKREFGSDSELLADRQCFLCDARGKAIGTATAWFDDDYENLPYGRLHWVAVVPEMQGRGLSKPLLSIVLRRMRELGHERAYLSTSTGRVPAINLYLKFGFVPGISNADDYNTWRELQGYLKESVALDGPHQA
ncbi:MAG TPA: GNAT family N-acetyltransferase [Candidatus Hydrogenedentes bacterium]|nr:GNAT family N-acetyltransferase [Candidatus Hydrogenedentota bacterium]